MKPFDFSRKRDYRTFTYSRFDLCRTSDSLPLDGGELEWGCGIDFNSVQSTPS